MQSAVRHRTFQLIKAQKKNITCSSSRLLSTYIKIDHQVSAQTHLSSISPHGSRLHLLSKELSPTVVHEKPGPGVVREVISRNDQKGKGDPGGRFKSSKAQLWGVPELPTETSAAGGELELSNKKFAIVEMGGTQHKVVPGDVIVSEKLRVTGTKSWDKIGSIIDLTKEVLLVGSQSETSVGLPTVGGGTDGVGGGYRVKVRVEEITRDETVIVFKKRRRKHSRRRNGKRRQVTLVRVLGVSDCDGVFGEETMELMREGERGWVTSTGRVHGILEGVDVDVYDLDDEEDDDEHEWDEDEDVEEELKEELEKENNKKN